MDIFHKFFMIARNDRLFSYNPPQAVERLRVMDLGTGTGIWAINVAEE